MNLIAAEAGIDARWYHRMLIGKDYNLAIVVKIDYRHFPLCYDEPINITLYCLVSSLKYPLALIHNWKRGGAKISSTFDNALNKACPKST